MYLIAISRNGVHHCGCSYTHIVGSRSKMDWFNRAEIMARHDKTIGEVYAIHYYSQAMCEMDNDNFVSHVRRNGIELWKDIACTNVGKGPYNIKRRHTNVKRKTSIK